LTESPLPFYRHGAHYFGEGKSINRRAGTAEGTKPMDLSRARKGRCERRETTSGSRGIIRLWRPLALLLVLPLIPASLSAASLTCRRLPMVMKGFLANHYAMKEITPEIRTNAVEQMIKALDPAKTLFYESDLDRLRPLLRVLYASAQAGDCGSLSRIYDLVTARARENEAIVKKILGPDYRHDAATELNINVSKRPYVKTPAEKQDLLRRLVQFQIENALLAGTDLAEAKRQQIHRYELQTLRAAERTPEKLVTTVAEAFALALDPHSGYLSPENLEDLRIHMQLSLEGIGASLSSENGFTVIEELIPGGGAERSGLLKPKDRIIAVAQEGERPLDVIDMELRDVVKLIRGRKGTRVTLTILRQAERTERFDITIVRDKVDIKEQEAKIEYETRTVNGRQVRFAVIDLPSFYGDEKTKKSSYEDVRELLAEAAQRRVDGIVLDLSRNGGGLLREAVRLAGLFIGEGGIVATKDSQGRETILANGSAGPGFRSDKRKVVSLPAEDPRALYTGPLVVLTSRLSASASEIVAGALKDYRRAVIVGSDRTFGKGSVQEINPLPSDLGGMKVTTGLYFLPGGRSTQKMGVEADVPLPVWFALQEVGESELDYPLPVQAIAPFLGYSENAAPTWRALRQPALTELASRSKARVAKDPKFIEILKNNREAAAKKDVIKLADLRKEMEKENGGKKKETPTELRKRTKEQYAPFVAEGVNVLLDLVALDAAPRAAAGGR
jgi:carboxyl-terminal processing protease